MYHDVKDVMGLSPIGRNRQLMAVLLLLLLESITSVNSERDTQPPVLPPVVASFPSATTPALNTTAPIRCGDTQRMVDECFKDLPPHLMEFLQNTKVVVNEQEIAAKCNVFHRGMSCFEEYTARCLTHEKRSLFRNNVEGAQKFFHKFCGDRAFQSDYLRHKDCFTYIQDDWMRCTNTFQQILREELHLTQANITHKFMEFCCARYSYEECIFKSARYKCYRNSAKFARDTAKMLSDEKHFSNCRQYERAICSGAVGGLCCGSRWPWLQTTAGKWNGTPLGHGISLMVLGLAGWWWQQP